MEKSQEMILISKISRLRNRIPLVWVFVKAVFQNFNELEYNFKWIALCLLCCIVSFYTDILSNRNKFAILSLQHSHSSLLKIQSILFHFFKNEEHCYISCTISNKFNLLYCFCISIKRLLSLRRLGRQRYQNGSIILIFELLSKIIFSDWNGWTKFFSKWISW